MARPQAVTDEVGKVAAQRPDEVLNLSQRFDRRIYVAVSVTAPLAGGLARPQAVTGGCQPLAVILLQRVTPLSLRLSAQPAPL